MPAPQSCQKGALAGGSLSSAGVARDAAIDDAVKMTFDVGPLSRLLADQPHDIRALKIGTRKTARVLSLPDSKGVVRLEVIGCEAHVEANRRWQRPAATGRCDFSQTLKPLARQGRAPEVER